MLNFLNPYMFYIKLAGFVLALAAAAGAAHYVDAAVYGKQIVQLKLDKSEADNKSVTASLNQLQGFIDKMHSSDASYQTDLDAIKKQFATIQQELANAIHSHPLPVDCKPDAGRLRVLTDAVAAANARASSGK